MRPIFNISIKHQNKVVYEFNATEHTEEELLRTNARLTINKDDVIKTLDFEISGIDELKKIYPIKQFHNINLGNPYTLKSEINYLDIQLLFFDKKRDGEGLILFHILDVNDCFVKSLDVDSRENNRVLVSFIFQDYSAKILNGIS